MSKQLNNLLSPTERKILLAIGTAIFALSIVNTTYKIIGFHNSKIEFEQKYKLYLANQDRNDGVIEFPPHYSSNGLTIYETVLFFQIFTVPVLLYLLWKYNEKLSIFNIILIISLLNLSAYLMWIYASYIGRKGNDVFDVATDTFQSYLMMDSNFIELLLFICFSVFSIALMFCLLRFIIEKFQIK